MWYDAEMTKKQPQARSGKRWGGKLPSGPRNNRPNPPDTSIIPWLPTLKSEPRTHKLPKGR
jgi:hypothetical protein